MTTSLQAGEKIIRVRDFVTVNDMAANVQEFIEGKVLVVCGIGRIRKGLWLPYAFLVPPKYFEVGSGSGFWKISKPLTPLTYDLTNHYLTSYFKF